MRKFALCIILLTATLSADATHLLVYYTYHYSGYVQGPWVRQSLLVHGDAYLHAERHEEYYGTDHESFALALFEHLKTHNRDLYNQEYNFGLSGDTVLISASTGEILHEEKNEITATFLMNNYDAVRFTDGSSMDTWTMADITLPFMDLFTDEAQDMEAEDKIIWEDPEADVIKEDDAEEEEQAEDKPLRLNPILLLSLALNGILIGALLLRSKKN